MTLDVLSPRLRLPSGVISLPVVLLVIASSALCTPAIVAASTTPTTTLSFVHHTVSSHYVPPKDVILSRTATTGSRKWKALGIDRMIRDEDITHQRQRNVQFIAKTVESFKLADLYWLESCVMAYCQSASTRSDSSSGISSGSAWEVRRLAFNRPTASYLLGCYISCNTLPSLSAENSHDGHHDNRLLSPSLSLRGDVPFRKNRCQYVAQIVASGSSPPELLENISKGASSVTRNWTLDYDIVEPLQQTNHPRRSFSSTMLMCALSRILPGEPMLTLSTSSPEMQADIVQYMIIETSSRLYLAQKRVCDIDASEGSESDLQSRFRSSWSRRPYQYSGAINLDVAIAVVDILRDLSLIRRNSNPKLVRLLDPTCGSGTFLALAMMMWGEGYSVEVTGIDSNPKCARGTIHNLQHLFDMPVVEHATGGSSEDVDSWSLTLNSNSTPMSSKATIYSGNSVNLQSFTTDQFDCAVANLPWNRNTFEFQVEAVGSSCTNSRIIEAIAASLLPGSPFVVISGGNQGENQLRLAQSTSNELQLPFNARQCLENIGFQVLGEATVPPRGFHLPVSGKKDSSQLIATQEQVLRSSNCVITVAVAPNTP